MAGCVVVDVVDDVGYGVVFVGIHGLCVVFVVLYGYGCLWQSQIRCLIFGCRAIAMSPARYARSSEYGSICRVLEICWQQCAISWDMLLRACLGDDVLDMMMTDVRVFGFEKHSPVSSCPCEMLRYALDALLWSIPASRRMRNAASVS